MLPSGRSQQTNQKQGKQRHQLKWRCKIGELAVQVRQWCQSKCYLNAIQCNPVASFHNNKRRQYDLIKIPTPEKLPSLIQILVRGAAERVSDPTCANQTRLTSPRVMQITFNYSTAIRNYGVNIKLLETSRSHFPVRVTKCVS